MRVISGSARGRRLLSLEGLDTRPTTDRVKESVFNIIMPYIRGAQVLDLFAGSGAMGIEALSRGAKSALFAENNSAACEVIQKNLTDTKLSQNAALYRGDALSFLKSTKEKFSLVFLDPPYDGGFYLPVLTEIAEREILAPEGVLVLEKRADAHIEVPSGYEVIKDRKYGKTAILVLTYQKGETI